MRLGSFFDLMTEDSISKFSVQGSIQFLDKPADTIDNMTIHGESVLSAHPKRIQWRKWISPKEFAGRLEDGRSQSSCQP